MADETTRTTRAVILARGLGTRMRHRPADVSLDAGQAQAADAGLKAMIPFGRPFLDFLLHSLADAGIADVALVLGPEHEQVRSYYRALQTTRIQISFVEQARPLGTADAVVSAQEWTGRNSFLVLNADNLYPVDVLARLTRGSHPALPGFERDALEIPIARIGTFALLDTDARGALTRIVEKPGEPAAAAAGPRALISMNLWRFDAGIFAPCRDVRVSARGERELPHAVALALERGVPFEVVPVRGRVLDLSSRGDVPAVARALEGRQVML